MHDYGRDHVHDRGRGRGRDHDDDNRHNAHGHDDVRHDCGHGCFCFHIFIHNKPPRGLHRPTDNNKKTYSTFTSS